MGKTINDKLAICLQEHCKLFAYELTHVHIYNVNICKIRWTIKNGMNV